MNAMMSALKIIPKTSSAVSTETQTDVAATVATIVSEKKLEGIPLALQRTIAIKTSQYNEMKINLNPSVESLFPTFANHYKNSHRNGSKSNRFVSSPISVPPSSSFTSSDVSTDTDKVCVWSLCYVEVNCFICLFQWSSHLMECRQSFTSMSVL